MTEEIGGVTLHYERIGRGGRKVLMLHGWGCDISLMKPVADRLGDGYEILIPDFPGHGESGRPPEPWGVPEYARCVTQMLDKMQFCPCAVIAHSFGARVATWIAAGEPERFDALILTGAAGIRPPQTEEGRKRSEQYQRWKRVQQQVSRIPLLKPAADRMRQVLQQKYGSRDYNQLDDEMKKTFVKVIGLDLTDKYPQIRQPTLLLWGDRDTETPLWMGKKMEELIPDAALILLEGGSHFAYLEQADRFAVIADRFLRPEST